MRNMTDHHNVAAVNGRGVVNDGAFDASARVAVLIARSRRRDVARQ